MEKAIIGSDNLVDNIIECDENFTLEGVTLVDALDASIGDGWDGANFVPAPVPDIVELNMEVLRTKRDQLISATDWRVLPDQPVSQPWLDYRQALRDLPANTVDPLNPTWPTEPGE